MYNNSYITHVLFCRKEDYVIFIVSLTTAYQNDHAYINKYSGKEEIVNSA